MSPLNTDWNACTQTQQDNSVGCARVMNHLNLATYDKVDARMKVAAEDNGLTFKAWDTQFGRRESDFLEKD